MEPIPKSTLDTLRQRVDVVDLVGRYVSLSRRGQNYKGLCPFHQEKTPSFNVNPTLRLYKCFGCGVGGDAIDFLMRIEGATFLEAVRKLAEIYGVPLPATARRAGPGEHRRQEARRILAAAASFYEARLWDPRGGEGARAYLKTRGISPETARRFRLGYAPAPSEAGWNPLGRHLAEAGLDVDLAVELGLLVRSDRGRGPHDRFRGRLMFPVIVPGGDVVAFSGRILPAFERDAPDGRTPKYLNSPESFVYTKGKVLYGLAQAREGIGRAGHGLLVEGNVDVVRLHEVGIDQAVAPLGTAFTDEHARRISRFVSRVVLCFDGDGAGRKATFAAMHKALAADLDVRVVLLPDGADPADTPPEDLRERIAAARPALEVWIDRLAEEAGASPDARARALDRVLPVLCSLPRPSARSLYAQRAAAAFDMPLSELRRLARSGRRPRTRPPSTTGADVPPSPVVRPQRLPFSSAQLELLRLLLGAPHLANRAVELGALELVDDPVLREIVAGVVEAVRAGRAVDLPSILERVPEDLRDALDRALFEGVGEVPDDAVGALCDVLAACDEARVRHRLDALGREERIARSRGDDEALRRVIAERIETARHLERIRKARAAGNWSSPISQPLPTDAPA